MVEEIHTEIRNPQLGGKEIQKIDELAICFRKKKKTQSSKIGSTTRTYILFLTLRLEAYRFCR